MDIKKFNDVLKENIDISNMNMDTYVGLLFQSRDIAHIVHLSTQSYAEHKALNDYYDGLLGLIDTLCEQFQGKYGLLNIVIPSSKGENITIHLTRLETLTTSMKTILNPKDGNLSNTIDSIQDLINSTLYKLKFLK